MLATSESGVTYARDGRSEAGFALCLGVKFGNRALVHVSRRGPIDTMDAEKLSLHSCIVPSTREVTYRNEGNR